MTNESKPHSPEQKMVIAAIDSLRRWGTRPIEQDQAYSVILEATARLVEQLEAANERLSQYEEPGWMNAVQKVIELKEQLEAAHASLALADVLIDNARVPDEEWGAMHVEYLNSRAVLNPASVPRDYCNWGTVCRLPVSHEGPHEYPASEREDSKLG